MKKAISAWMAFWLTWLPQVGPTVWIDTWFTGVCDRRARVAVTWAWTVFCCAFGRLFRSAWTS